MNEPLTMSSPGVPFSGKTHNNHPQWHNQPLRLTKAQRHDPLLVLDDFFECYHLNDVRQILWDWLSDVISSQRSIANDPLDRNNHMYFYEKIESIIEAALVIKNRIHKHRRRKEKRKLKKGNQSIKFLNGKIPINTSQDKQSTPVEPMLSDDIFNKPKQLIEYVYEAPLTVIAEVFKSESLIYLNDLLNAWLKIVLSADSSVYDEGEQRGQLLYFKDQLSVFVEALYIINRQNIEKVKNEREISQIDTTSLLTQAQIANPMQVIASFFQHFHMAYIKRELNDCLEASMCFDGEYPANISKLDALYTYRNILCLIKSAHSLLNQKHIYETYSKSTQSYKQPCHP
jgi:hypothetical protein